MTRYPAEPMILQNAGQVIYLQKDRDIENARDFYKTGETTCSSQDPRLVDTIRNIHMDLDSPPLQPKNVQPLQHIYDGPPICPGFYRDYESIYPGDLRYYIDPDLAQAYNDPNYVIRSAVKPFVFQDPMGGMKPQYDRVPLFKNQINVAPYSFDRDQMSFREDLMARQSRIHNQSDYIIYAGHFAS
jgi:hypothetical protein